MKSSQTLCLLIVAGTLCFPAHAATCRASTAAQAGSDAGYERDREASEAWSSRENQVSSGLQQCLGSIGTAITVPTFPSLDDVLSGIKDKVCSAARDKIADYVPDSIDPWKNIPGSNGKTSVLVTPSSYAPTVRQAQPAATQTSPQRAVDSSMASAPYSW